MRSTSVFVLMALCVSFAGCNTTTPAQIAAISCYGAQAGATGAAGAVAVTTDASTGSNATKAAAQAQRTASISQKAVGDTCRIIVTNVDALNAEATGGRNAGK